jgi:hypothetical protein
MANERKSFNQRFAGEWRRVENAPESVDLGLVAGVEVEIEGAGQLQPPRSLLRPDNLRNSDHRWRSNKYNINIKIM